MEHCVAVRADGQQVLDGVNDLFRVDVGQLFEVVDVDVPLANLAVDFAEVHAAGLALRPVMFDAGGPSLRVALVLVGLGSARSLVPNLAVGKAFPVKEKIA
jgi:hypothetical protein